MKQETLYKKTCKNCGNNMMVTGRVYASERKTEVTTRDSEFTPTCSLFGERGVMCLCGKTYRMMDRRAWHMVNMEQGREHN